jgi:hypothetical protein
MNIAEIEVWLKNSIPGIIILGALGGVATIILLRIFSLVAPKAKAWIGAIGLSFFIFFVKKIAGSAARAHVHSVILSTPHKIRTYYTSLIMRFCLYLFIMTWCLIFILAAALMPESESLRRYIFPSAFVFFFLGVYTLKTYIWLQIPHWLNLDIDQLTADAIANLKKV